MSRCICTCRQCARCELKKQVPSVLEQGAFAAVSVTALLVKGIVLAAIGIASAVINKKVLLGVLNWSVKALEHPSRALGDALIGIGHPILRLGYRLRYE